jgi:hypothetical protein
VVLAHALFGNGGPDFDLLILAVALLAVAGYLFFQKSTRRGVPVAIAAGGLVMAGGSFLITIGGSVSSDARVEITAPDDGELVPAQEPTRLAVAVRNGELTKSTSSTDPSKGHLHVFVDGELVSMPTTAEMATTLPPGEHTITVEFTAANHTSFSPRVTDEIEVTAR